MQNMTTDFRPGTIHLQYPGSPLSLVGLMKVDGVTVYATEDLTGETAQSAMARARREYREMLAFEDALANPEELPGRPPAV